MVANGDAMIVDELGDAADAVAAHFGVGAVGVEHPHAGIGDIGRHNQNQPIGTNAFVPVTHRNRGLYRVFGQRVVEPVHIDVIIPRSVHLREPHDQILPDRQSNEGIGYCDPRYGFMFGGKLTFSATGGVSF